MTFRPQNLTKWCLAVSSAICVVTTNASAQPADENDLWQSQTVESDDSFDVIALEHPDEIVTEERYLEGYINYKMPPGDLVYLPLYEAADLRYKSEVELAAVLAETEHATSECKSLRLTLESQFGGRAGYHSVHKGWVEAYQDCLLQRRSDLQILGSALDAHYRMVVDGGGDDGVADLTTFIDQMRSKHARISYDHDVELRTQRAFVSYYGTGLKDY